MKPELQWEIEQYRKLTVLDLQQALNVRTAWYDAALAMFGKYDYLALPAARCFHFPFRNDGRRPSAGGTWTVTTGG